MKLLKILTTGLVFVLPVYSAFALEGDLDVGKFVQLANSELERIYGAESLESEDIIYFQDGFNGSGGELSTLTLMRKPKIQLPGKAIDRVGYRLRLVGKLNPVLVSFFECERPFCESSQKSIMLKFGLSESSLFSFMQDTTSLELQQIGARVRQAHPNAFVMIMQSTPLIIVKSDAAEMYEIISQLSQEGKFEEYTPDAEAATLPLRFRAPVEISQRVGVLNVDTLRTLTAGKKSKIPEILRP